MRRSQFAPDGLVLVAYGQLVPQDLLDIGARPPLNVHPSLLPRHQGAAPVAGTILAGDREGGVTLMVMTAELDAGPIVARWAVPLTGRETTPELETALADLSAEVVPPELERWAGGLSRSSRRQIATRRSSDRSREPTAGSTGGGPRSRSTGRCALQPWPGAWTTIDGRRVHPRARPVPGVDDVPIGALLPGEIPCVACGTGALALEIVQPEGRSTMAADAWRRGLPRSRPPWRRPASRWCASRDRPSG